MFPLRDHNPTVNTSAATFTIIGLNLVAWFALQQYGSEPGLSESICRFGAIPGELLGAASGEGGQALICPTANGASWWTTITSMFMHGGWFHVLGNMWFLYIFGDNVEDSMGPLRFVIFYLLCGLAAVAAQTVTDPGSVVPMVGASGAIGGIMGAYAVLYPKAPVQMVIILGFFVKRTKLPALYMLGFWFVMQIVGGVPALGSEGGGVAFWAHIGGFLAGVVLIFVFRKADRVAAHRAAMGEEQSLIPRRGRT